MSPTPDAALATSSMSLKPKGIVPTAASAVAQCKQASLNPETGEPFTVKVILEVCKTRCYGHNPDQPWQHLPPNQKTALSPELKAARAKWAKDVLDMGTRLLGSTTIVSGWIHAAASSQGM